MNRAEVICRDLTGANGKSGSGDFGCALVHEVVAEVLESGSPIFRPYEPIVGTLIPNSRLGRGHCLGIGSACDSDDMEALSIRCRCDTAVPEPCEDGHVPCSRLFIGAPLTEVHPGP